MRITHAKVSGLSNPSDPTLVGGEDWDAEHVFNGPTLVNACDLVLTTGGAIQSQQYGDFGFTKQATGTYRAIYDPDTWGGGRAMVIATISTPSGAPRFTCVTLGFDETNCWMDVVTIDATGAAVNGTSGTLTIAVFAISS